MKKTATENKKSPIGSVTQSYFVEPEKLVIIGLDTPHKVGEHPLFDERAFLPLDENMVLNVMMYGVTQEILVRREGDQYLVILGRQRTKWAREANKRLRAEGKEPLKVKCSIRRCDDATALGLLIAENEVRQADSPVARARKLDAFLAMGRSEQDAAITFGVSLATIKARLSLLELAPEVQDKVSNGKLGMYDAIALKDLPRDEQVKAADQKVEAKATGKKAPRVAGERPRTTTRPGKREVLAMAREMSKGTWCGSDVQLAMLWAMGEIEEPALTENKALGEALADSRKAK